MKITCVTILFFLSMFCQAQTFIIPEDKSNIITEYNDGKLWIYRNIRDFVVGITCYEEKDDYGKYYQINVFGRNLSNSPIIFYPDSVYACLQTKKDIRELEVYTNEEWL